MADPARSNIINARFTSATDKISRIELEAINTPSTPVALIVSLSAISKTGLHIDHFFNIIRQK